jgi:hypothetical protein
LLLSFRFQLLCGQAPDGISHGCEEIRASAMGDTSGEALVNLREAIEEMIREYGETAVFQDINPQSEVQVIEVAV